MASLGAGGACHGCAGGQDGRGCGLDGEVDVAFLLWVMTVTLFSVVSLLFYRVAKWINISKYPAQVKSRSLKL